MGRQAYFTRLALGRSPFEEPEITAQAAAPVGAQAEPHLNDNGGGQHNSPESYTPDHYVQQFDVRGHPINPASRYSTRALIRAQNDVLATVGVCVGATDATGLIPRREDTKSRERLRATSYENHAGLVFLATNVIILSLATCGITGLRYRLQIYPMLSQLPLAELMKVQIKQFGFFAFVFAGLPAYTIQTMGYMTRAVVLSHLQRWISRREGSDDGNDNSNGESELLLTALDAIVRYILWLCLTPLGVYGQLQQLFLLPPYSPLPTKGFLAQFLSMLSPRAFLRPKRYTLGTFKQLFISLLQSPLISLFAYSQVNALVDSQVAKIIRLSLPRIGTPDVYSVTAAKLEGLNGAWLETLDYDANDQPENRPWPIKAIDYFRKRWQQLVGKHPIDQTSSDEGNQGTMETSQQSNSELQPASQQQVEPPGGLHEITPTVAPPESGRDTRHTTMSSPEDSSTSSDDSPVEPPAAGIWVAHHRGHHPGASAVRVHPAPNRMTQNEAVPNTPHDLPPSEPPTQPPPRSRSPSGGLRYRVTCLSSYPLNALTSHLSTHFATLITLPLETYVIRRMVGSFVATGGSPWIPAIAGSPGLPLFSLPPGIGNSTFLQSFTYPRQLFLRLLQSIAMELIVSCVLVVAGSRGAVWYGIRYFGWGKPN